MTALRAVPLFASIAWFSFYAEAEAGLAPSDVAVVFAVGFGIGTTGYSACGRVMDRWGWRRAIVAFLAAGSVCGPALSFSSSPWVLAALLGCCVFSGLGVQPALGHLTVKLFPPGPARSGGRLGPHRVPGRRIRRRPRPGRPLGDSTSPHEPPTTHPLPA